MTDTRPRGLYFEEMQVGNELSSQGRTITETDLVSFAGLTGDTNPMHTDAEYAKTTQFGERVAHGMLGLSYAVGLAWQLGFMIGTVIAFTGLEWKFKAPVKIGDTIHMTAKVKQTKEMKAVGGGFVVFEVRLFNQRDEVTGQGEWTVLVKSKA
ncbi:MAG: MaoC family dehydratase N-terminal domain-containing protein [Chloroflexi bacterium]|nr:MaoC family dehydratase N-terminal domain-containing protein [Chloroflexota bacterium]